MVMTLPSLAVVVKSSSVTVSSCPVGHAAAICGKAPKPSASVSRETLASAAGETRLGDWRNIRISLKGGRCASGGPEGLSNRRPPPPQASRQNSGSNAAKMPEIGTPVDGKGEETVGQTAQ